jgi:cytosolic 5'-nucleotidase 3
MSRIIISNPDYIQSVIEKISAQGSQYFHVVADFDRTLTKALIKGKLRSSLEGIFEEQWFLGQDFALQSRRHFDMYYPIEINPSIPLEEKKKAMQERWTKQFVLLLSSGLTKYMIAQAMQSEKIILRQWGDTFLDALKTKQIPLLIFSASGLWYDGISLFLSHGHKLSDNIDIISNAFIRDEEGKAIAVKEPIIHSFNKDETVVRELPAYQKIKDRKNVLLLGDSPGDVHMADGFDYENIIKVGFLNNDTPELRKLFQETYDVIILDDGPMDYVNELILKITK